MNAAPGVKSVKIAVVGGGVGGMAAAYELKSEASRRGLELDLTVLESRDRIGGSVVTERVDGCLVEGGPDCFVSEKPWAMELVEELGLGDQLVGTNDARRGTYVLWRGRPHPLPDGLILLVPTRIMPFVTARLFTWRGKFRMALDLVLPRKSDGEDETLGDFIRRRLGGEALDKLGEPLVAGIHSGDPETMSIRATFPRFVDMEREDRSLIVAMLKRMKAARAARAAAEQTQAAAPSPGGEGQPAPRRRPRSMFVTLDEGLGLVMSELRRQVGDESVRTGTRVTRVAAGPVSGWDVETEAGETFHADGVLFASPAYETAAMVRRLSGTLAAELEDIPYVSSATVTLAYSAATFPSRLTGFGLVVPKGEHRRVKAFTWVTSKFFGRAPEDVVLMRCFIRATAGETEGMTEAEMAAAAQDELRDILGVAASPLWARAYRWDRAMAQYVVGHLARVDRIDGELSAFRGLRLAGGAYRGTGIPDTVRYSRAQARALLDDLTGRTEG